MITEPDAGGHFGVYGGRYVPEVLMAPLEELEIALKKANAKFSRRFRAMERLARENGQEFKDLPREKMEAFWEATKRAEGRPRLTEVSGAHSKQ